ncbi:hypothetical protein MY11210_003151 [Beauveria gryllotalpidicola]
MTSPMDVDKRLGSITLYEAMQIWERFHAACSSSRLVLWSGIGFQQAEIWARDHDRQTLTQAMGSLMDKSDPACRHHVKTAAQWRLYVHAASILFTLFISTGPEVVVLTPHPPQRLNPHGASYYQRIEEPWLKACCDGEKFKIIFAHPRTKAARDHIYEYWPTDRVEEWTARYPGAEVVQHWGSRNWDVVQQSSNQQSELRQTRATILEKMFLYTKGRRREVEEKKAEDMKTKKKRRAEAELRAEKKRTRAKEQISGATIQKV